MLHTVGYALFKALLLYIPRLIVFKYCIPVSNKLELLFALRMHCLHVKYNYIWHRRIMHSRCNIQVKNCIVKNTRIDEPLSFDLSLNDS